ncbi:MAG: FecR family protein [Chitinophagaceae bacterium]|nr:FecR family protein [Chitinophagaceae bacterium]
MSADRYWILLGKKKAGEATEEDLEELRSLLDGRDEDEFARDVLEKVWIAPMEPVPETFPHRNVWHRVQKSIYAEQDRAGKGRLLRITGALAAAAVLLAVIIAGLYMSRGKDKPTTTVEHLLNQVATQTGSKTKVALPDGTLVWLNANSQLTYENKTFGIEERAVTLVGEAFFDVTKNEKAPFIIHTRDMTIRVLGTAFTVKAYPRDKTAETALIRGLVEITTRRDPERKIVLKPNEKIVVPVDTSTDEGGGASSQTHAPAGPYSILRLGKDSANETVWIRNKLEFDNLTWEELAPKLERWYNIHIHFEDERIRRRHFSGVIEKETLTQTLEAMRLSGHFVYEIKGNELWLREN